MNENELRIGNLVHHLDNWSHRQPEQDFKEFDFKWEDRDWYAIGECTMDLKDILPIPLTEEWLVKFGFINYIINYYLPIPEIKAEIHFEMFRKEYVCILYCSTGSFIPNDIKYVHQLQNLYFCLTGEELVYDTDQPA